MASIRNYNAFLRAIKEEHGLSHKEAQGAARLMREHLGRPVFGVDVQRHPRLSSRFAMRAGEGRLIVDKEKAPGPEAPAAPGAGREFRTLDDYINSFDEDSFEFDIDFESTAEYKES